MNKKHIIILIFCCLLALSIEGFYILNGKKINKDEARNFISEYIQVRYNNVNWENIGYVYELQDNMYSNYFKETESWVNSKANIDSTMEYFNEYKYCSYLIMSSTECKEKNWYTSSVCILYIGESPELDNIVRYVFDIEIIKESNRLCINDIKLIENKKEYIDGGEIHKHDNEVVICHNDKEGHQ